MWWSITRYFREPRVRVIGILNAVRTDVGEEDYRGQLLSLRTLAATLYFARTRDSP